MVKLGTQFSVLEVGTVGCYLRFSSTVVFLYFCSIWLQGFTSWLIPNPMASFISGFYLLRCHATALSRMAFGLFDDLSSCTFTSQALSQYKAGHANHVYSTTGHRLWNCQQSMCGYSGRLGILLAFLLGVIMFGALFVQYSSIGSVQNFGWPCLYIQVLLNPSLGCLVIILEKLYSTVSFCLFFPVLCGLMPFASLKEWWKHFLSLSGTVT